VVWAQDEGDESQDEHFLNVERSLSSVLTMTSGALEEGGKGGKGGGGGRGGDVNVPPQALEEAAKLLEGKSQVL
jgi:hypothetical protein